MQQRPKYKRSGLNISMIPTIAEEVEHSDLPSPRRRRASSCSGPPPEIAAPAPTPPTPPSEEQKPQQQVRKRATEPDLRKFVVVTEATRVYNVYGRVYLDDIPPPSPPSAQSEDSDSDYGSVSDASDLVDPNEQVFLVMKARRRTAARANKRARKPLQVPPPQCMGRVHAKAGSTTAEATTTVNVAGDEHSHTTDSGDQLETSGVEAEAVCIEQQHAEKLDEIARSLAKMSLIPKKKDSNIKCSTKKFDPTPGAGRIRIGKDLQLTAEMLSKVPEDRQWGWIRRWVDMMLQRLGEFYDAVYETNLRCSDLCYAIASAECDVEFARQIQDAELEGEAQGMVNALKARKGDAVMRRDRFRGEASSKRQLYEDYYRDLMDSLGHPELKRPVPGAEESFDPCNPFKSFSRAV